MNNKILVTYATRAGSTAGVAEAIAKTLREHDLRVDVRPMQEVPYMADYKAVLAGSAIQNRGWLPEAIQFVKTHRAELNQKPFAMFAVCMTLAMKNGEKYRPQVSDWLAPVRRLVHPVSEGIFAGVLDIGKIPSFADRLKFRLSVLFGVWSEGDHRDWDSIRAWADIMSTKLF
jgi:menaquinone-dependent protoporphyrinogen oxidase